MTVIIDTPVWSLAYRRKHVSPSEQLVVDEYRHLVQSHRAVMIGVVRQEVLSGVREKRNWERLRTILRAFEDLPLMIDDFENAALNLNTCRGAGVQGSLADFLICSVAQRYAVPIFTTDKDFAHMARHIPLKLHRPTSSNGAS